MPKVLNRPIVIAGGGGDGGIPGWTDINLADYAGVPIDYNKSYTFISPDNKYGYYSNFYNTSPQGL